ncbi:MAG: 50S ribosomal protein L3 [Alphaproteobacteria bacterium]
MRVGVIAKKVGVSAMFDQKGDRMVVTLLLVDNCQVVAQKTQAKNGYVALQVGAFNAKPNRVSKPLKGFFAKANVTPKKISAEFRVIEGALVEVGTSIEVDHYVVGQFIDITGVSIGKGFAGAMKRHNFLGLEASHGVSVSHRSHGSTGQRQDPGKVFKGKKMAGHLGMEKVTLQNIKIAMIDKERKLLAVHGSVPGAVNSYVIIKDAVKRVLPSDAPYPVILTKADAVIVETTETTEVIG